MKAFGPPPSRSSMDSGTIPTGSRTCRSPPLSGVGEPDHGIRWHQYRLDCHPFFGICPVSYTANGCKLNFFSRKGAKLAKVFSWALCVFAPLRESRNNPCGVYTGKASSVPLCRLPCLRLAWRSSGVFFMDSTSDVEKGRSMQEEECTGSRSAMVLLGGTCDR